MDGSTAARGLPSLWDILTTPSVKLATLLVLLAGAGFVGSASPWFALVLPTLAWRFAGSVESYYVWDSWHYNAVLVPIAACSLLDVINRWCEPERAAPAVSVHAPVDGSGLEETGDTCVGQVATLSPSRGWRVAAWVVACVPVVSLALTASSLPLWHLPDLKEDPRMAAALGALDAVPEGVSVETDTTLLARLVPGRDVYWVGTTVGMDTPPEYVVVDRQSYAWGGAEVDAESWASAAHPGHTYETIYSAQGFRVARRTS